MPSRLLRRLRRRKQCFARGLRSGSMIQRMSIRPFANITGLDLCDIGRNTVVGKPRILQLLLDTFCTKAIEIDNVQNNAMNFHRFFHVQEKTWCLVPEAGLEPARLAAGDFESPTSTNFITRAYIVWCPGPDSNRHTLRREILSLLCLPISPPGHALNCMGCSPKLQAVSPITYSLLGSFTSRCR